MMTYLPLGFMWHTQFQILTASLGTASMTLSQLAISIVGWLVHSQGMELRWALCVLMVGVALGTAIAAVVGPSGTEYREQAERVFGTRMPPPPFRPLHMTRDALDVMLQRKGLTLLAFFVCIAPYMLMNYWIGSFVAFASATHGAKVAATLAENFSVVTTAMSVVMSLFTGWLVDRAGLRTGLLLLGAVTIVVCTLLMFPSIPAQYATMCVGSTFIAMFTNVIFKMAVQFSPPDLVGIWSGLLFAVCGAVQIGCNFAVPFVAQRLRITGLWQFQTFYLFFGAMTIMAIAAFVGFTAFHGVPAVPECRTKGKPLFWKQRESKDAERKEKEFSKQQEYEEI